METKLWYDKPANGFTEALPLGNGNLGAMVYGGLVEDKILLNSDTLWSGSFPRKNNLPDIPAELLAQVRTMIFSGRYYEAEQMIKQKMLGPWTESYVGMGSLRLTYQERGRVTGYYRELDLATAVATARTMTEAGTVHREIFASAADHAVVVSIRAEGRPLSMEISLQSRLRNTIDGHEPGVLLLKGEAPSHVEPNYVVSSDPVQYDPENPGLRFCLRLAVKKTDGRVEMREGGAVCTVEDARHVVLVITAQNGYAGYNRAPETSHEVLAGRCLAKEQVFRQEGYEIGKERHRKIHRSLFERVSFDLQGSEKFRKLPLDKRLADFREHIRSSSDSHDEIWSSGNSCTNSKPPTDSGEPVKSSGQGSEWDKGLFELLFQYGRYLLICSSRDNGEFTQPANLQGIWCGEVRPVWSSNYTTNINLEMNYWLAGIGNLSECDIPLIRMIEELRQAGGETARNWFHAEGFAVNHNTDLWRQTGPVGGEPKYAYWPMAGVWLCSHLYQHYLFTGDLTYLKEQAYPIMREAVRFVLSWLTVGKDGRLHTVPSTSPENTFFDEQGRECAVSYSSTMDQALVKELFGNFIELVEILEIQEENEVPAQTEVAPEMASPIKENKICAVAAELKACCQEALLRLPDYQVGKHGQLQEWIEDYPEADSAHRHLAHLTAFHPFAQINKNDTPKLLPAVRKVLERRQAGQELSIGWNQAWLVLFYARLEDGRQAGHRAAQMLARSVYDNLLDLHPPLGEGEGEREIFQIDGNFGITAGMAEMLLQSHLDTISLLPALPPQWERGRVSGLKARGNVEVTMEWAERKLQKARLTPANDGEIRVEYSAPLTVFTEEKGQGPVSCYYDNRQYQGMPDKIITGFNGKGGTVYTLSCKRLSAETTA